MYKALKAELRVSLRISDWTIGGAKYIVADHANDNQQVIYVFCWTRVKVKHKGRLSTI